MREVSKEEFYNSIGHLDCHPSVREEERTIWELRNRTVVGITYPGWKNPESEKKYLLPA